MARAHQMIATFLIALATATAPAAAVPRIADPSSLPAPAGEALGNLPPAAQEAYKQALTFKRSNQWKEAIAALNKGLAAKADSYLLIKERAECYSRLPDLTRALADLNYLVDHFKRRADNMLQRADVERRMGRTAAADEDKLAANEILEEIAESQPMQLPSLERINAEIKRNPNNRTAYLYKALHYRRLMDYKNAAVNFSKVIEIPPEKGGYRLNYNLDQCYYDRADCYQKIGNYTGAIADYNSILKLDPDAEEAFLYRGNCKAQLGQWGSAAADYTQSIEHDIQPTKTPFLARAKAYEKLGKMDLAKRDLEKVKHIEAAKMDF